LCDTLVALGNSTLDGSVIFGKNSDRPSNEAQLITYTPRKRYSKGEEVKCTYISIPQVTETNALLMSQPFWLWGAEMASNEYNVVIGNEAVYSYEPLRGIGLLGMDLLRLGLERGKTAKEALYIITELLEKYHQGGGCAYDDSSWIYHNSFLIADSNEAYVLETADDWWIAEEVKNVRSISNWLSIRGKGDVRRKDIIQHAVEKGYCKDDDDFDFAATFTGSYISNTPSQFSRGGKSTILLQKNKGNINSAMMMEFLREHEAGLCMHGSFESTGSQVSQIQKGNNTIHWFTGTTLPCLSIYKPYTFPIRDQEHLNPGPYSKINPDWIWVRNSSFLKDIGLNQSEKNKFINSIKTIENNVLRKVRELQNKECSKNHNKFINQIIALNQETWNKTKELIK
jgi:secernin